MYELPESFIREFKDKVDWIEVFRCQKHISDNFINEFRNKINQEMVEYESTLKRMSNEAFLILLLQN
jgi:hypothetical protein